MIRLLIFTTILLTATFAVWFAFPHVIFNFTWALLAYFAALTAISFYVVNKGMAEGADFVNYSMGVSGIRLFVSAGLLMAYFFNVAENRIPFTVTFFIYYFCFTVFEISILLSKLHRK